MGAPLVGHRHCSGCGNESLEVRRVIAPGGVTVNVGACMVCDSIKCPRCGRRIAGPFDPKADECSYCHASIKMVQT